MTGLGAGAYGEFAFGEGSEVGPPSSVEIALVGALPPLSGAIAISTGPDAVLAGTMPVLTGAIAVDVRTEMALGGEVPSLAGAFTSDLNSGVDVELAGQISLEGSFLAQAGDVLAASLLGTLALNGAFVMTTATAAIYSHTFTQADGALGAPEVGGPYTVRAGTWNVLAGHLRTSVSTAESQITFPAPMNVDAQVKVAVFGSNGGLLFRWVDVNNTWLLSWNATSVALHRRTSGSWQQMTGAYNRTMAVGDVWRVIAIGRDIRAYRNGVLIFTVEDQFHAVAGIAAGFRNSSDTGTRVDEALVYASPASLSTLSGDEFDWDLALTDPNDSGLLYKGRDTKLADEGAVA